MARVVVLGAGISGHTAALHLRRLLDKQHEVVVVSPNSQWNWIPSNIWVGVGRMKPSQVTFPLKPVYDKHGVDFRQAKAVALHPEGDERTSKGYVDVVYTDPARAGETQSIEYDYVINATGPKLNFAATPGLGPDGHTVSVCTYGHAEEAAKQLAERHRQAQGRAEADPRHRRRPRHLHVRGRGVRVHLQRRARAPRRRRPRPRRDHLPHQRVRARRLRRRRPQLQAERLRDHEQAVDRVAVQGARGQVDPARARAEGRGGQALLRDPRRRRGHARLRLRDAAPAVPRRGPAGVRRGRHGHHRAGVRAERVPQGRRRLHARSRSRSGRRRTGRAPTSARRTRTCSASASRSRRRTRSRPRARRRTAPSSRRLRRAPGCRRG